MKKKLRIALTIMFCCILALAPCMAGLASGEANAAVLNARNGVVRIYCDISDTTYGIGTGFAVGAKGKPVQYIVTNNHVIEKNPGKVYVLLDNPDDEGGIRPATVIAAWEEPDIAILQVMDPITQRQPLPLFSADNLKVTQAVHAIGFPGVSDDYNDKGSKLPSGVDDMTVTGGEVTKLNHTINGIRYIQTDTATNKGNSGGPMLDNWGNVVGINTLNIVWQDATDSDGNKIPANSTAYSIYIDYVINYLDAHGIAYWKGSITPVPTELWAGIAGGVMLLLAAFAVWRRKQWHKKPAAAVSADGPEAAAPYPQAAKLKGVKGVYAGSEFPLGDKVVIGRDPAKCNIVLPSKTAGVSAVHCQVVPQGDGVLLTDLGSSNGTFLTDGSRLAPDRAVFLSRGDVFCLGSQENAFRLE